MPSSIYREIGQLLIGSFSGTDVPAELRTPARDFGLGGVILFSRNVEAPEQVADLSEDIQTMARDLPLWVSIDQEGGRVARLKAPFTEWPPMAVLGRSGDALLASRFAAALAAELTAVGITLDYAPVLDIHTNPKNPVIGDRALAEDADTVARLGTAIVTGLQDNGVAACGKHFPGHGDTSVDSHVALPIIEHPPDRIRRVECVPFRAAIDAGVAFIMTAHVLVPSFDEDNPATLSRNIVYGLLRSELGFEGVILSDDLEMKAVAASCPVPDAAVRAIAAGCDGVLICGGDVEVQVAALEALIHAAEDGRLPYKRVEDALRRQLRAKERFLATLARAGAHAMGRPAPRGRPSYADVVGCDEHRRLAEEMARFL